MSGSSQDFVRRWYREIFGAVPDASDLSTYAGSLDQALSGTNGPTVTAVQNVLINFLEQAPPNPMLEQVYGGPLSQNPDGGNDHRRLMIYDIAPLLASGTIVQSWNSEVIQNGTSVGTLDVVQSYTFNGTDAPAGDWQTIGTIPSSGAITYQPLSNSYSVSGGSLSNLGSIVALEATATATPLALTEIQQARQGLGTFSPLPTPTAAVDPLDWFILDARLFTPGSTAYTTQSFYPNGFDLNIASGRAVATMTEYDVGQLYGLSVSNFGSLLTALQAKGIALSVATTQGADEIDMTGTKTVLRTPGQEGLDDLNTIRGMVDAMKAAYDGTTALKSNYKTGPFQYVNMDEPLGGDFAQGETVNGTITPLWSVDNLASIVAINMADILSVFPNVRAVIAEPIAGIDDGASTFAGTTWVANVGTFFDDFAQDTGLPVPWLDADIQWNNPNWLATLTAEASTLRNSY